MDGMPEFPSPGGEPQADPGSLSNSQIEAGAETYDADLLSGDISQDEYDALPHWKKTIVRRQTYRRREAEQKAARAEGALDQMRREMAELRTAVMQNGHSKASDKPEPEGWAAVKTPKLEEYVTRAEQAMHAALLNPDNEDIKKQAASIDPAMLATARRELAKRDAAGTVAEKEKGWEEQKGKEQALLRLQSRLRTDFGDDIFRPQSDLMRAAAQEMESMGEEKTLFGESAAIYMAVERAHKRLHGAGRAIREDERARLGIESGVRREAAPLNEIEALRAKGDWKSRGAAVEKTLDIALSQLYG